MSNKEKSEIAARLESFGYAFDGWKYVLKNEHNAWIHAIATVIVVIIGIWLRLPRLEWAILLLCISTVMAGEMINTAIEAIVDLVTEEHKHPLGKVAKDAAAGAVLWMAVFAATVGAIILFPPLWERLFG